MVTQTQRQMLYPNRIAAILGSLKILAGAAFVVLGCLALFHRAAYAEYVSGIWGGVIVAISGVLGVASVRMNAARVYVAAFLFSSLIALVADVLVIIYSSTGLASDSGYPGGFVRDRESGELIPVSLVNLPAREMAMLVNLLLIIVGVLEVFLTLPSFIVCLRDIFDCYNPSELSKAQYQKSEQKVPRNPEWLMSWLGQQNQIYYSGTSGIPYSRFPSYPTFSRPHHYGPVYGGLRPGQYVFLPSSSELSRQSSGHSRPPPPIPPRRMYYSPNRVSPRSSHLSTGNRSRKKVSPTMSRSSNSAKMSSSHSQHQHQHHHVHPHQHQPQFTPLEVYPTQFYFPAVPSPNSNLSHPSLAPLVPVHHPQHHVVRQPAVSNSRLLGYNSSSLVDDTRLIKTCNKRHHSKHHHHHHHHHRLTDSDLDKTYTGLDRELAEEFIEQTMAPDKPQHKMSATESEAW